MHMLCQVTWALGLMLGVRGFLYQYVGIVTAKGPNVNGFTFWLNSLSLGWSLVQLLNIYVLINECFCLFDLSSS